MLTRIVIQYMDIETKLVMHNICYCYITFFWGTLFHKKKIYEKTSILKTRTIKSLKEDEIPSVSYITIHEKNLNVNCI